MKHYFRRSEHARYIDRDVRLSSAHSPIFSAGKPVPVTFVSNPNFDYNEAAKNARRVTNLQLLKKYVFGDDVARMAERAEIAPDRLSAIVNLDLVLNSEMTEHIEKSLGLPGGWLDIRRDDLSETEIREVLQMIEKPDSGEVANDSVTMNADSDVSLIDDGGEEGGAEQEASPARSELSSSGVVDGTIHDKRVQMSSGVVISYEDLRWLHAQLSSMPRGSKSRLAKLMGRHTNDLSMWLNGHRPLPLAMHTQFMAALRVFDASLAERFTEYLNSRRSVGAESSGDDVPSKVIAEQFGPASKRDDTKSKTVKERLDFDDASAGRRANAASDLSAIQEMALRTAYILAEVVNLALKLQSKQNGYGKKCCEGD